MMQKRLGAAVLAAALAGCALAGCGEGTENKGNPGNTQKQESQQTPGETETVGDTQAADPTQAADDTQDVGSGSGAQEETNYPEITSDEEVTDFGSVVVVGNAAYELYTYLDEPADSYAQAINKVAENLSGKAQVYDLVIPLFRNYVPG